jgi:hypothetical protein
MERLLAAEASAQQLRQRETAAKKARRIVLALAVWIGLPLPADIVSPLVATAPDRRTRLCS